MAGKTNKPGHKAGQSRPGPRSGARKPQDARKGPSSRTASGPGRKGTSGGHGAASKGGPNRGPGSKTRPQAGGPHGGGPNSGKPRGASSRTGTASAKSGGVKSGGTKSFGSKPTRSGPGAGKGAAPSANRKPQDTRPPRTWKSISVPKQIQPNNDYGQNFLVNPELLDRELDYAGVGPEDRVLEIGPGTGNLTERLCQRAKSVTIIEIDRQFEAILTEKQSRFKNLSILWGDATTVPYPEFDKVVANLPYQVSLPIIFRLLEHSFDTGILIIQERMARRLAARPGQSGYSRISIVAQRIAGVRVLEGVGRHNFRPPPAVESAMLRLRPTRPNFTVPDEAYFRDLVGFAFLRRDATLRRAFASLENQGAVSKALSKVPADLRDAPIHDVPGAIFGQIATDLCQAGVHIPEIDDEFKREAQSLFR